MKVLAMLDHTEFACPACHKRRTGACVHGCAYHLCFSSYFLSLLACPVERPFAESLDASMTGGAARLLPGIAPSPSLSDRD
jgi:hypothetical protein